MTYRENDIAELAARLSLSAPEVDIEVRIAALRSAAEILQQSLAMKAMQAAFASILTPR